MHGSVQRCKDKDSVKQTISKGDAQPRTEVSKLQSLGAVPALLGENLLTELSICNRDDIDGPQILPCFI